MHSLWGYAARSRSMRISASYTAGRAATSIRFACGTMFKGLKSSILSDLTLWRCVTILEHRRAELRTSDVKHHPKRIPTVLCIRVVDMARAGNLMVWVAAPRIMSYPIEPAISPIFHRHNGQMRDARHSAPKISRRVFFGACSSEVDSHLWAMLSLLVAMPEKLHFAWKVVLNEGANNIID